MTEEYWTDILHTSQIKHDRRILNTDILHTSQIKHDRRILNTDILHTSQIKHDRRILNTILYDSDKRETEITANGSVLLTVIFIAMAISSSR
jgi:hypothetical protein